MKHFYFLFLMLASNLIFSQGSEDFTNSNLTSSYSSGSFTGNGGVVWEYAQSRDQGTGADDYSITGNGIMLRRASDSYLQTTLSGGVGEFSFQYKKAFTGSSPRQLELIINGTAVTTTPEFGGTSGADATVYDFSFTVNQPGAVIVKIKNVGTTTTNRQVTIDNIVWTAFAGTANPSLTLTAPTEGQIFNPETTNVDVAFNVLNFAVANGTGDGHIQYTVDGGSSVAKYDTTPINLTGLASGNHTVYVELVDNTNQVLDPAVNAIVNFSIASYTQVANLAALRAAALNEYYQVTGEVVATYAQDYNHQKWAQDATAGIIVHDPSGIVTTVYNLGDGITGAKGQLIAYNQLLELKPTADFGAATSTGNTVTPLSLTIADLNTGLANYESELIKLSSVTISDFTGSGTPDGTFQSSKNYPIADASGTSILRTNFSQAEYIGQAFPTSPIDMVCLVGNYNGTAQVTPRSLADITVLANEEIQIEGFSMYPNPTSNQLFINTTNNLTKNIQIFDVLGKQVQAQTLEGNKMNLNLTSGIYIIKIEEAGKLATQKLVIE